VYIGLLQIMVLPYIVLSLVSGVGRLSMYQGL
jgi:Na+/H+-dicarboxylate symporter